MTIFLAKIGARILGFFGGRFGSTVAIAAIVGVGILSWQLSGTRDDLADANQATGEWKERAQGLQTDLDRSNNALDDWKTLWANEKARRIRLDLALQDRERERQKLNDDNQALKSEIGVMRRENETVDEYLGRHIPGPLLERLRQEYGRPATTKNPAAGRAHN